MGERIGPKPPRRVAPKVMALYNALKGARFPEVAHKEPTEGIAEFMKRRDNRKIIPPDKMSVAELEEQNRKLFYIKQVDSEGELLQHAGSMEYVVKLLASQVRTLFGPDAVAVIVNRKGKAAIPISEGVDTSVLSLELKHKEGILNLSIQNNEVIYVPDTAGEKVYYAAPHMMHMDTVYESTLGEYGLKLGSLPKTGFKSVIAVPIFYDAYAKKDCVGVLFVASKKENAWNPSVDLPPIRQLVNFAGIPLKHKLEETKKA